MAFILGRDMSKTGTLIFRLFATFLIFLGSVASAGLVWDLADMCQGLMVITNIPSILILGGIAIKCLKDYERQRAEGLNPVFLAKNIDLKQKTDYWN